VLRDSFNVLSTVLGLLLLGSIAFGGCWTAYESHVANQGVAAMANAISNERGVAPREERPRQSF